MQEFGPLIGREESTTQTEVCLQNLKIDRKRGQYRVRICVNRGESRREGRKDRYETAYCYTVDW